MTLHDQLDFSLVPWPPRRPPERTRRWRRRGFVMELLSSLSLLFHAFLTPLFSRRPARNPGRRKHTAGHLYVSLLSGSFFVWRGAICIRNFLKHFIFRDTNFLPTEIKKKEEEKRRWRKGRRKRIKSPRRYSKLTHFLQRVQPPRFLSANRSVNEKINDWRIA